MNTPNFELIGHMLGDYHDLQSDGIVDAANRFPLGVVEEQIRLLELFEPAGNATLANRIAELEREKAGLVAERDAFAIRLEDSEEQYSELHNKNSALAAQVEALRVAAEQLLNVDNCEDEDDAATIHSNMNDVLLKTPQHHLLELRAGAVRDFIYWGTVNVDPEFAEFKDCAETFIEAGLPHVNRESSDSIRRGEVE